MKKKYKFLMCMLLAICSGYSVKAQTLLYDAAGAGETFVQIGGTTSYSLNLNGNIVNQGSVVMTEGANAVSLAISPAITGYSSTGGGLTLVMLVSDVDVLLGGQFMSLRQTVGGGGFGGLKIEADKTDGTLNGSWNNANNQSISSVKYPTDKTLNVVTYAYIRKDEQDTKGDKSPGSIFYINDNSLGSYPSLQTTNTIGEIALGGISSANSTFLNTGMRIHRVQLYAGQLTADQVATANEAIKTDVSPLLVKISEVKSEVSKVQVGKNPGQYSEVNYATLQNAITTAEKLLEQTLTDEELATAMAALETAKSTFLVTEVNGYKISTEGDETWYYITNCGQGTATYAAGHSIVMNNASAGDIVKFAPKSVTTRQFFKLEDAGDGKVYLKNYATGMYIGNDAKVSAVAAPHTITYLGEDAQFTLKGTGNTLHAQQNNSELVTWAGGLNSASAWYIQEANEAVEEYFSILPLKIEELERVAATVQVGLNPGQYTAEEFAKLQAAIAHAKMLDAETLTTAEYAAAVETLETVHQEFITSTTNPIKLSTAGAETWYFISGNDVMNYTKGKSIIMNNDGAKGDIHFAPLSPNTRQLFKFEEMGEGVVSIKNYANGKYIGGGNSAKVSDEAVAFKTTYLGEDAQFTIRIATNAYNTLHLQENNSILVEWSGGVNTASAFYLIEADQYMLDEYNKLADYQLSIPTGAVGTASADLTAALKTAKEGGNWESIMKALESIDAAEKTPLATEQLYRIVNAYSQLISTNVVNYNGTNLIWQVQQSTPSELFVVEKEGEDYALRNVTSGQYLKENEGGVLGEKTALKLAELGYGQYNITIGSTTLHANPGSGGSLSSWSGGFNSGSAWYFVLAEVADVTIPITSAGYATTCQPYDLVIPSGVTVYGAHTPGDGKILMDRFEGEVLAANTPVILRGSEDSYKFAVSPTAGTKPTDNILKGTLVDTPAEANSYYALGNLEGIGFYISEVTTIPANKAYLSASDLSEPAAAKAYRFVDDQTTSITDRVDETSQEEIYYDLSGRRVEKPTKGLYIVKGKKIVIN